MILPRAYAAGIQNCGADESIIGIDDPIIFDSGVHSVQPHWAAYNLVAIPVAAGLFVRWGLNMKAPSEWGPSGIW